MEYDDFKEMEFPPDATQKALKLAAFQIMKDLRSDGKITEEELAYIRKKSGIRVE